ncbi:hypothetical protein CLSAP_39730 [Clostridium saccharoperbutylacetonicum]|nr:hypothetical protein CLSAP_39730 [Clostridium saccharoperbutylacetonicum]NSB32525.1 hypothetical protein [Clostridium saccharoperbutylacetonicum]
MSKRLYLKINAFIDLKYCLILFKIKGVINAY